jgi:hypothetical protein
VTPADLRDRIDRARQARTRPELVDAYVIALADLADLAEHYLDSLDAYRVGRTASLAYDEKALRDVVVASDRIVRALARLGEDGVPATKWEMETWRKIAALHKPPWWRRAWRWIVRPH